MKTKIAGLLTVALLAGPVTAQAAVLYSNLGAGDSFSGGQIMSGGSALAFQFTAASTALATSVDAAIQVAVGATPPITFTMNLYADSGSNTVGTLLESFSLTTSGTWDAPVLATASLGGSTLLTSGQRYWLEATGNWRWNINDTGVTGTYRFEGNYFPFQTMGAFRINGSPPSVPEPGVLALLGLGLAGLGLSRRRKSD